ncbi:MAG: DUF4238 domain-containing protein [Desulfobaccales bacterium]
MSSIARRHHYLPQAYLAPFTDTGAKDGRLYVLDTNSGVRFHTSPKNVAVELDFNRVDIEGKSPDTIEKSLADFEESATQMILKVNCTKTFPNDEDFSWIINLLCLIAVRNPQLRKLLNRSRELAIRVINDLLVSDKKIWAHHLKKAQEAGYIKKTNISFEECKTFIKEGKYKIEFTPESNLRIELRTFDRILKILGQRTWSLLVAPASGPNFICSDHPVALAWKNHSKGGPIGYGLKNTEVFFPVSPQTAFYGVYEDFLPPVVHINPPQVALMNTRIANSAERHVFSAMDTFSIWEKGGMIEIDCTPSKCRAGTARRK